ncbi:MAG: hypothetical protein P4L53_26620 [Candidatus Obscuribacterales bacterium]|nr:hypothetical protein [Candidatus Obscuribacterales bacterium]
MTQKEVHSLLGPPDGISTDPPCEFYKIMSGHTGNLEFAIRYQANQVHAYSIGSFSTWNSGVTNQHNPAKWIVKRVTPGRSEDLFGFSKKQETETIAHEFVKPKERTELARLERSLLCATGQACLDSKLWKTHPELRSKMLFSVYMQPWFDKPQNFIEQMLGAAQTHVKKNNELILSYTLPSTVYERVELNMHFLDDKLKYLEITATDHNGLSGMINGEWVTENLTEDTVASDWNKKIALVGMPVKAICQFMGPPQKEEHGNRIFSGNFEFEYDSSEAHVKRFRAHYDSDHSNNSAKLGQWQVTDYHPCASTFFQADFIALNQLDTDFNLIYCPFTTKEWCDTPQSRSFWIGTLVRKHKVIGMQTPALAALLGPPDATVPTSGVSWKRSHPDEKVLNYRTTELFNMTSTITR